jgi:hypothetical protein
MANGTSLQTIHLTLHHTIHTHRPQPAFTPFQAAMRPVLVVCAAFMGIAQGKKVYCIEQLPFLFACPTLPFVVPQTTRATL